jgi:uncharacterized protein
MRRKSPSPSKRAGAINALRKYLEARPEILCAYLHGSFLSSDSDRDVDVAVWIDPSQPEAASATRYGLDLSTALTLALGESVDVQVLNGASLAFRYHVLKGQPLEIGAIDERLKAAGQDGAVPQPARSPLREGGRRRGVPHRPGRSGRFRRISGQQRALSEIGAALNERWSLAG